MAGETLSFTIEESHPHERLDAYLKTRFPVVSRGTIQRLLKQKDILINGVPAKPTYHPKAGDKVEVTWPEPKPARAQPEDIPLDILFEDGDLLVLNKPPGIVVHPSAGHEEGTLVNALLHHCEGQLSGIGGVSRPGIVHRLDQDTSGCLVVAKNDVTHLSLSQQFAGRDVKKVYKALLCGSIEKDRGDVRAAIARHPSHRKRMAVTDGGGRDAWTTYEVVERLRESTLINAHLHTGRTHQIRVHCLHIGHPLVGDAVYGKRYNNRFREATGYVAPRQLLHAWKIGFTHPVTGEPVAFEAAIPQDLKNALSVLRAGG